MELDKLRVLQLNELEMVKQIIDICKRHNLTYYAIGGTLLGAVRHQGFIPWDDDVDLALRRKDYDSFIKFAKDELTAPFYMKVADYDQDHLQTYVKIYDSRIKLRRDFTKNNQIIDGSVDIFPLDGMPNGKLKRFFYEKKVTYYLVKRYLSCFHQVANFNENYSGLKKLVMKVDDATHIFRNIDTAKVSVKLNKYMGKVDLEKCDIIANPLGAYRFKERCSKAAFEKTVELPFEDITLSCPAGYEEYLVNLYGDYHQLPPLDKRNHHGVTIVEIKNN